MLDQGDYGDNNIIPVLDQTNKLIAMVDPELFADGSLEGTFRLNDGRVLNVSGAYTAAPATVSQELKKIADKKYRGRYGYVGLSKDYLHYFTYTISNTTWGIGTHNKPLYPFVSVAADPIIYPFGTVLYCPILENKQLPNGETHLGYLSVDDVGSAILGQHCDFFTGTNHWANELTWLPDYVDIQVYKHL